MAELNVPDALPDGPRTIADLARAVGAHERSLHRVMRTLVSAGVFAEPEPGTYALTPMSELLRSDAPTSMRDLAVLFTATSHWQPWGRLADTLRTGESDPRHAFDTDIFPWFQRSENQDEWALFNAATTSFSTATSLAVAETYDFSRFTKIVDIGGDTASSCGPSWQRRRRCAGWSSTYLEPSRVPTGTRSVNVSTAWAATSSRRFQKGRLLHAEAHHPRLGR